MSHRLLQVNETIQRELSLILAERTGEDGAIVTLTQILTSPDLRTAVAWVSILNSSDPNQTVAQLNKRASEFYEPLSKRLKMKYVPVIEYRLDENADELGKIDAILDRIKE